MQGARREQPLVGCDRRATQQIGMHRRSTSVRHSFSEGGMSPYLCDGALSLVGEVFNLDPGPGNRGYKPLPQG